MNLYKSFIYAALILGSLTNLCAATNTPLIKNPKSRYNTSLVYTNGSLGYGITPTRLRQSLLALWGEAHTNLIEAIVNAQSPEERRNLIVMGDSSIKKLEGVQQQAYMEIKRQLEMPSAGAQVRAPSPINEPVLEQVIVPKPYDEDNSISAENLSNEYHAAKREWMKNNKQTKGWYNRMLTTLSKKFPKEVRLDRMKRTGTSNRDMGGATYTMETASVPTPPRRGLPIDLADIDGETLESDLREMRREKAATTIQAGFRGMKARQEADSRRHTEYARKQASKAADDYERLALGQARLEASKAADDYDRFKPSYDEAKKMWMNSNPQTTGWYNRMLKDLKKDYPTEVARDSRYRK